MMHNSRVSIIICTHNRSSDLKETICSLARLCLPADLPTELLVIANACTDGTDALVQATKLPQLQVVFLNEPRKGKGNAYNTGMAAARGEVLLFTDDDVRVPPNWVSGMSAPILAGKVDVVAGEVKIAPHLQRDWMRPIHLSALACTDANANPQHTPSLVGASMGFSRSVLTKVPAFDTELGPGALGFKDETLLGEQFSQCGYRMSVQTGVPVEHHFDAGRLNRSALLRTARHRGWSSAYVDHHWNHKVLGRPRLELLRAGLRLWVNRVRRAPDCRVTEGCSEWEYRLVRKVGYWRRYLIEMRRPRNYEYHGLVKLR